ncbi:MAG: hypothetical protein A2X64_00770 [Ignavibacteria bacterium GWF2_33_9]|nr:MAG: hypothetical protein A2X64_00770 [Ignavibacteria bacterium GWF2_33_9]
MKTKLSIAILALMLFVSMSSFAQSPLPKGRNQFNAGVGFSNYGIPIYLGFDHAVHNNVSLGGEVTYRNYYHSWKTYRLDRNVIGLHFIANYHFNSIMRIPSNFDFYAGLGASFYIWDGDDYYDYHEDEISGLRLRGQVGGRYYWSKNWGLNLEFGGGGFSDGRLGISYRY